MMQTELFHPSWPQNSMYFSINEVGLCGFEPMEAYANDPIFDPLLSLLSNDSSALSSLSQLLSFENSNDLSAFNGLCDWMESSESQLPLLEDTYDSVKFESTQIIPHIPPLQDSEFDHHLGIFHLVRAYGEAMEMGKMELVEVILKRLEEKACLSGKIVQRLVYYLVQSLDSDRGYLMHESCKNYEAAFLTFYQTFLYGKFAHFSANSMILNFMLEKEGSIRIFDFDMGEGVQWASLIESLGRKFYRGMVTLTSIKWEKEEYNTEFPFWSFEKVKMGLLECANYYNVKLKVNEIEMNEIKEQIGDKQEWLVFNCMVNLPHMGRLRSVNKVNRFFKIARDSIYGKMGIITFGDGESKKTENMKCSDFGSFIERQFCQLHALIESMDWCYPSEVLEARIVMECLFVAPFLSSLTLLKNWNGRENSEWEQGLEGLCISEDCVEEAKELVGEGESLYWVKIEATKDNQLVLGFMGTPLVRVSCWR